MERTQRQQFEEALQRAAYYRWCAARGHVLTGGDPITGEPRKQRAVFGLRPDVVGESRAAYVAMARYWLTVAHKLNH